MASDCTCSVTVRRTTALLQQRAEVPPGTTTSEPSARRAPDLLTVGFVAQRLGVSPAAVRSWGRRYGLTPSTRTGGQHRRFTLAELDRLVEMQALVRKGLTTSAAARQIQPTFQAAPTEPSESLSSNPPAPDRRLSLAAEPGIGRLTAGESHLVIKQLTRMATCLDVEGASGLILEALTARGVSTAWHDVVVPALSTAATYQARTGNGIDIEHALAEASMIAIGRYRTSRRVGTGRSPILLVSVGPEPYALGLHALSGLLAEQGVPVQLLGLPLPAAAVASALSRRPTQSAVLWKQVNGMSAADRQRLRCVLAARRALTLGGPGWTGFDVPTGTVLITTVSAIAAHCVAASDDT